MSCTTKEQKQQLASRNLTSLREMWNGGRVELKRLDGSFGKSRYVGKTI